MEEMGKVNISVRERKKENKSLLPPQTTALCRSLPSKLLQGAVQPQLPDPQPPLLEIRWVLNFT